MRIRPLVLIVGILHAAAAQAWVDLYDGSLNTLPQAQGWLDYQAIPTGPYLSQGDGFVTLNTSASDLIHAGFSNYAADQSLVNAAFPVLDRHVGAHLRATLRVDSESHASAHRAGFSITLLSQDLRGIELGFWTGEVWAQNDSTTGGLFTRGESAAWDTTAGLIEYELSLLGEVYRLSAGGQEILTGSLRDYSDWQPPPGASNPYALPGFLFLGDNTGSARGSTTISHVSIIPEPAGALLVAVGLAALMKRRRLSC